MSDIEDGFDDTTRYQEHMHTNASEHTTPAHRFMSRLVQHMNRARFKDNTADTVAHNEKLAMKSVQDFIAEGGCLSDGNNDGDTALYLAATCSNLRVMELLLCNGADPCTARTKDRETPLHAVGATEAGEGVYN